MLCAGQDCKKALAALFVENNSLKEVHEKRILELEAENITMRDRMEEQDERMVVQDKRMVVQDKRMAVQEKRMAVQDKARFKMFKANILVDLVKRVFVDLHLDYPGNLEEIKDTKKTRNAQAALSLNQRQLEVFFGKEGKSLGPQYYRYIGARNETAHETYIDFAVLLHSENYREKDDYWKWANLFPYVYGKRVEAIVNDLEAADENELFEKEEWGPVGYAAGDKM